MHVSRYVRAATALGHLLLVVVLAMGVFVMHSMGHPDSASNTSMGAAHASATTAHPGGGMPSPQGVVVSLHSSDSHQDSKTSSHSPAMGMDMASLCVAVLGTWILAGLLRAVLSRGTDWPARLRDAAVAVLRPNPPPRRPPDLARLSILRI
ncbi:hypothetical protein JK364_26880 [Streptomyces sp. 110]|uniref:DUF2946 domain-containing protein n=1 Tax=Streptomyces endocoffeicus TaxID=2898945 RepID=A0ABS1PVU0_9ACTN|nr:DUF6153 family protein [Streptomyces endocoffeicus]MBL1116002.1 hypothetical protein [Streptomyces endocoffeicus]